ncbi:NAD(P)/FAD-dependent oxidoreductase [Desulfomarina sp.]
MFFDMVIIGGGPAGLACAEKAAEGGLKTLVIERKEKIGPKVCAGGITWNGLIKKIPGFTPEKEFPVQFIRSRWQKVKITSPSPIVATISREKFGGHMAERALNSGARIRLCSLVKKIAPDHITVFSTKNKKTEIIRFQYLVGADGSNSIVRRYLNIPSAHMGVGINYQIPGDLEKMEWFFDSSLFGNGYSWIFPHRETVSIGTYAGSSILSARQLKENLIIWAANKKNIDLSKVKVSADYVNFDFRGWKFDNFFLAGDAAGLASGLTGEGIYPAILSGEMIAQHILDPSRSLTEFSRLLKKHRLHRNMAVLTGKNRFIAQIISELVLGGLRSSILKFHAVEMANQPKYK